jgi:hypothetical protein
LAICSTITQRSCRTKKGDEKRSCPRSDRLPQKSLQNVSSHHLRHLQGRRESNQHTSGGRDWTSRATSCSCMVVSPPPIQGRCDGWFS